LGSLLPGPCRIYTRHGLGRPGLHRLLLDRRVGDAKLGRLGALTGKPLVGLLDQSPLPGERRPHAALITNEKRLAAGTLLKLLTMVQTSKKSEPEKGNEKKAKNIPNLAYLQGV
jgi:hypothetical protein